VKFPETIITLRQQAANRINLYEFVNQEIFDTLKRYNKYVEKKHAGDVEGKFAHQLCLI
jgi:hypothetical protein